MRWLPSRDSRMPQCLSRSHAPRRSPRADPVRRVLQARRLPHRPDAAGRAGADHARPFRPCARRPRRGAGDAGNARHHAAALRRGFRRRDAGDRAMARRVDARRRHGDASIRPAMCSARRRSRSSASGLRIVASGDYKDVRRSDLRAVRAGAVRRLHHRGDVRPAGVPPSDAEGEIAKLLHSVALFPERAHLVGAYSLGKAQRVIALLREAGYDEPIYLHGAMETITRYYQSRGIELGELELVRGAEEGRARRHHHHLPAVGARATCGRGAFPIRSPASRRAGCGCAPARASAASSCRWSFPTTPTGTG